MLDELRAKFPVGRYGTIHGDVHGGSRVSSRDFDSGGILFLYGSFLKCQKRGAERECAGLCVSHVVRRGSKMRAFTLDFECTLSSGSISRCFLIFPKF
jgi:hypothetical protein